MITLDNFESNVPYKILMRGLNYYESDCITELEETSQGEWEATVEGTESYEVEISMDGRNVESWYCDCPYDGGICKHVVAVLFAIRDDMEKVQRSAFSKKTFKPVIPVSEKIVEYSLPEDSVDIPQLLKFVVPEQLKQFVCDYAAKNQEFKESLLENIVVKSLKLSETPSDYNLEIQHVFNTTKFSTGRGRYSRYDDFEYDWITIFNKVDSFLAKADILLKSGNLDGAITILLQILRSIGESYDESLLYEDNVYVSGYCERVSDLIMNIVQHPQTSELQKNNILQELREIAELSTYRDYDIFDIDELIMNINILVQSPDKAINLIDSLLEERKESYDLYKLVLRKIELLDRLNEQKKAANVISQYLYLPEIRRSEIEKLMLDGQYPKAIKLADEGIVLAQKEHHIGTVDEWLRLKLDIYELSDNAREVINTCRQLFIHNNGSLEYYRKLKTLIPAKRWKAFLNEMMEGTKFSDYFSYGGNIKADILVEEKDDEHLFQLLSSVKSGQLDALMKYAPYLKNSHSKQLLPMFASNIRVYAENNLGRNHYEYVARALLCMRNLVGGKAAVGSLVEEFRIKYKRRPAMMEILGGF